LLKSLPNLVTLTPGANLKEKFLESIYPLYFCKLDHFGTPQKTALSYEMVRLTRKCRENFRQKRFFLVLEPDFNLKFNSPPERLSPWHLPLDGLEPLEHVGLEALKGAVQDRRTNLIESTRDLKPTSSN
jgi:hypothetical protein